MLVVKKKGKNGFQIDNTVVSAISPKMLTLVGCFTVLSEKPGAIDWGMEEVQIRIICLFQEIIAQEDIKIIQVGKKFTFWFRKFLPFNLTGQWPLAPLGQLSYEINRTFWYIFHLGKQLSYQTMIRACCKNLTSLCLPTLHY